MNPILVPLSWFWVLIAGCGHPIGLLYLFLVGTAFLVVRLSEDHYMHAFVFALLAEPLHTVFLEDYHYGVAGGFDIAILIIVILTYEAVIGGLYWWYLRQLR